MTALPFIPKRIYWTYYTPDDVVRGNHSHHELEQILVAVSGKVTAVSDSIVTIDNTIICNFKTPDTSIKNEQSISVKGRLVGFDDLMGELKLDQCSINKNN